MKKFILILLLVSAVCSAQQNIPINDSLKSVYIVDTFMVKAGVLIAKDGTGFIPFRSITVDQLQYMFELIAYFEQGNKLKKLLEKK